jgi:hypothetical protein
MSTAKRTKDKTAKKAKGVGPPAGEPWAWLTRELLESPSMRSLSPAARACLDRLMIEHMHHAGKENGRLVVTYDQFADFGIRRRSVAAAIAELRDVGLVMVDRGRRLNGFNDPNRYELTWIGTDARPGPLNRWKAFTADAIATQKADHKSRLALEVSKSPRDRQIERDVEGLRRVVKP